MCRPAGNKFQRPAGFFNAVYSTPYSDGGLRVFAAGEPGCGAFMPHPNSIRCWMELQLWRRLEARASRRFFCAGGDEGFHREYAALRPVSEARRIVHDIQASIGLIVHLR